MLGLSSFVYRWAIGRSYYQPAYPMTPRQFVNTALHHQVGAVMFCHNFPFENYSAEEINEISTACKQHSVVVEMGARGSDPNYFIKLIHISHCMGASILRLTMDVDRSVKANIPLELQRVRNCLKSILPAARQFGVRLAIENYIDLPSPEIVALIKYFNDPHIGVCYDSANSILGLENPVETARLLAPYTITVHLKDVITEMNPRGNIVRGMALGDGMVDFPAILQHFQTNGYNGCFHLELYIDRKEDPLETVVWEELCVECSLQYARQILGL